MRIKYWILWGLFFCTSLLNAQQTLTGTVTDSDSREVLPGVLLYLPDVEKYTTTDQEGRFSFKNLPASQLVLKVSFMGYESQIKQLASTETHLDIELKPSVFQIDEVIVSSHENSLQGSNAMKVAQARASELRQSGATTLLDGLEKVPGVNQITTGTGIAKPVIRGLSGNRVLSFAQGVRMENQQWGNEHGLGISGNSIEKVEIIKGPASLLYGSDALGGVLYFSGEQFAPVHEKTGDFNTFFSENTLGVNADLGFKMSGENLKFTIRGNSNHHSDYKTGSNERATNTRFSDQGLNGQLGFSQNNYSGTFKLNIREFESGISEGIEERSTSKSMQLPYQNIADRIFSTKHTLFSGKSKFDLNLGYQENRRQEFEDEHDHDEHEEDEEEHEEDREEEAHELHAPTLDMRLRTFSSNLKWQFSEEKKWRLISGLQTLWQENANKGEEVLIPNATKTDFGFFSTLNRDFKHSHLQLGIRYDTRNIKTEDRSLDTIYQSVNAAIGYVQHLGNLTLRANLASGFRAPNLAELTSDGLHHGSLRYEIGNPNLKEEQNTQLDFNLEYVNSHVEFFLNTFYNHIDNFIYLSPSGVEQEKISVYHYLQSDASLHGGEAGFHYHPVSLNWLHLESSYELVRGQNDLGNLPLMPADKWKNKISFRKHNLNEQVNAVHCFLGLDGIFAQDRISTEETATPGYVLLNFGTGVKCKLGKQLMEINFNVHNLLDKKYTSHLSRLKEQGIYNMGRNFTLGLRIPFAS